MIFEFLILNHWLLLSTFDRLLGLLVGLDDGGIVLLELVVGSNEFFADQTAKFKKRCESSTFKSNCSVKIGS